MGHFVKSIGPAAVSNSLGLVVLKSVLPGVPDFYQGTELFEPSLTDPDNRRPVDYRWRRELLATLPALDASSGERVSAAKALCRDWADGRLKLFVIQALLHFRQRERQLFNEGTWQLLETEGEHDDHVIAVTRRHRRQFVLAVVPRLTFSLAGPGRFPVGERTWASTSVILPAGAPTQLADVLTARSVPAQKGSLKLRDALSPLPVAVFRWRV